MLNNKYLIINILFNASALNSSTYFTVQRVNRTVQVLDYTDHMAEPYGSPAGP